MASSRNKVYVVTGANRGLGFGMVALLLQRASTTIIGTVRSQASAEALASDIKAVSTAAGSRLVTIILDFSRAPEPSVVLERLKDAAPDIDIVDVLIANAGTTSAMPNPLSTSAQALRSEFEVNTIGPLMVFQGLWPLLQKSTLPKFIVISSSLGSIGAQDSLPAGAYGPSKAAVNWLVKSIHQLMGDTGIVSVAIHPGFVKTAMGNFAAAQWGDIIAPNMTVEESVAGVIDVVDGATRENSSGKLIAYDGQEIQW